MTHINPTLPAVGDANWGVPLNAALDTIIDSVNSLDDAISAVGTAAVAGASGDGVTDDTAAIQSALAGGGRVYLPSGTYIVTGLTIATASTTLVGPGTLKLKAATTGRIISVTAANVTIDGITLDGNRAAQSGTSYTSFNLIEADSTSFLTVRRCTLQNGYGNGIALVNTSDSDLIGNVITNVHDNGIQVANAGSDRNRIAYNRINGTTAQNGIFLTASGDSSPTTAYIYDNKVIGNVVMNCGDTCIETGIHTVRTEIASNFTSASVNPAILLRDCLRVRAHHNTVVTTNAMVDGIAVVPQTETASWNCDSSIDHNTVEGPTPTRTAVYIGQSGIVCEDNILRGTTATTDGSDLVARGVCFGTGESSVIVRRNRISGFYYGVDCNYGATAISVDGYVVEENIIDHVWHGVSLYALSLHNSRINRNRITYYNGDAIKTDGGASGNFTTEIDANAIGPTLYNTGPGLVNDFVPWGFIHRTDHTHIGTVPTPQFGTGILALPDARVLTGTVTFGPSQEHYAEFTKIGDTVTLDNTSSTITLGTSGFSNWAISVAGDHSLILQRRGADTTDTGQFVVHYRYAG
jgi:parallel beta-helix repeat protein